MKLRAEEVPDGSVQIYGWLDGEYGESDLELVATLFNLGDGRCEVRGAKGELSDYTNIEIGLIAMEHGFTRMDFKARQGKTVTRHAEFIKAQGHFNYYTVDLLATAERLGIEGMRD